MDQVEKGGAWRIIPTRYVVSNHGQVSSPKDRGYEMILQAWSTCDMIP